MWGAKVVVLVDGSGSMALADSGRYVDMLEAGIVDPTKVVRTALENAVSVAGLLLTTECMIAKADEDDEHDDEGEDY